MLHPAAPRLRILHGALALAGGLSLLALPGCVREIQGNGVFRQEVRALPAFTGVAVESPLLTSIAVGPVQDVIVSGDANVLEQLETTVRDDPALGLKVLEVRVPDAFVPIHPLRVDLTIPELSFLRAEEAATVDVTGARGAALDVEASDGSAVSLVGPGGAALDVHLSGGSHAGATLDAAGYPVATATVALTGGAHASVEAAAAVTGTAEAGCVVENVGPGACQVTDGAGAPVSCTAR